MQEPTVRLRDNEHGRAPALWPVRKERDDFIVQPVGSQKKGDEGARIDESLLDHSRSRP
jgi:hypothetical protein